jgi:hypothetical protein
VSPSATAQVRQWLASDRVPRVVKVVFLLFMLVLVPVYWVQYGPLNFLWFSDITLFLAFFAVMAESRFLASMAAVGGLVLETLWMVDFVLLLFGIGFTGLTAYMADESLPIWLRGLSLFHVVLPPLLLWLVLKLGYAGRPAWLAQTGLAWLVVPLTWLLTDPEDNVNWVYSYTQWDAIDVGPGPWLLIVALIVLLVFTLTHLALSRLVRGR